MNSSRRLSLVFSFAALAVVALAVWYFANVQDVGEAKEETWAHEYPSSFGFVPQWPNQHHNGLVISPQEASEVRADQAYLEDAGFIVVHRVVRDSPGEVLGASALLQSGFHKDVPLNASLEPNSTYFALLYADDGDGVFAIDKDTELLFYDGPNKTYLTNRVAQFSTL